MRGFTKATRLRADVVPLPTLQKLTVDVQLQHADGDAELFTAAPVDTLDRVVAPEQREMGTVAAHTDSQDALLAALRVCCGFGAARMARVRTLLAHIAAAGTAGLALDAPVLAAPAPQDEQHDNLRALCNFGLAVTVFDVHAPRVVAREHAGLWCVQQPQPGTAPGSTPPADQCQPAAPWLFADGTQNESLAASLQHRLLCIAAKWPGIQEDALCAMLPLLPAHTRHLLAALTARGRLRRTTLAVPPTVTLFSSSHIQQTATPSSSSSSAGVVHCYHVVPPFCTSSSVDFLQL